jgi:sugar diacid utilization regulator/GAF domain-containing protein
MISKDDVTRGGSGSALERDLLGALASGLGSPQTLDEALTSITRALLDAGICSEARIYLYDSKESQLALRCVNGSLLLAGSRETVALGEGPVGRVATSLQAELMEHQALESLEERPHSSLAGKGAHALMYVPLLTRDTSLVGVVVLLSEQPAILAKREASIGQAMILAAAAIERAASDETLQRRGAALATLASVRQATGRSQSLDAVLERLVSITGQVMGAERCVLLLFDPARGTLVLRAASPALSDSLGPVPTLSLNPQMLERLRELSSTGQFSELSAYARTRVNPLDHLGYRGLLVLPLLGEKGWRGLLYCYYREERLPRAEDLLVLPLVTMQADAELGRFDLLDLLNQKYLLKCFFERLLQRVDESEETLHSHAALLGMDLLHPFCLVLVEVGVDLEEEIDLPTHPLVERIAVRVSGLLQQGFPGSLQFEQGAILTCLVDVSDDPSGLHLKDWLIERHLQLSAESGGVRISIGLSTPCQSVGDFRRGFTEAGQALQLGPKISPDGGVVHWSDIRIFSYLTNFTTPEGLRDRYQVMIETLARHDHTHLNRKDRLVETLEAFLEEHGVVARTAKRLGIHRNTVELRLDRIQEVTGVDLEGKEMAGSLFDLQLALRVYKLGSARID